MTPTSAAVAVAAAGRGDGIHLPPPVPAGSPNVVNATGLPVSGVGGASAPASTAAATPAAAGSPAATSGDTGAATGAPTSADSGSLGSLKRVEAFLRARGIVPAAEGNSDDGNLSDPVSSLTNSSDLQESAASGSGHGGEGGISDSGRLLHSSLLRDSDTGFASSAGNGDGASGSGQQRQSGHSVGAQAGSAPSAGVGTVTSPARPDTPTQLRPSGESAPPAPLWGLYGFMPRFIVRALTPLPAILPLFVLAVVLAALVTDVAAQGEAAVSSLGVALLVTACFCMLPASLRLVPRVQLWLDRLRLCGGRLPGTLAQTYLVALFMLAVVALQVATEWSLERAPQDSCGTFTRRGVWLVQFAAVNLLMLLPLPGTLAIALAVGSTVAWIVTAAATAAAANATVALPLGCARARAPWAESVLLALYTAYFVLARLTHERALVHMYRLRKRVRLSQKKMARRSRELVRVIETLFTPRLLHMAMRLGSSEERVVATGGVDVVVKSFRTAAPKYIPFLEPYLGSGFIMDELWLDDTRLVRWPAACSCVDGVTAAPVDAAVVAVAPAGGRVVSSAPLLMERLASCAVIAIDLRTLRTSSQFLTADDMLSLMAAVVKELDRAVTRWQGIRARVLGTVYTALLPHEDVGRAAKEGSQAADVAGAVVDVKDEPSSGDQDSGSKPVAWAKHTKAVASTVAPVVRALLACVDMLSAVRKLAAKQGISFELAAAVDVGTVGAGIMGSRFVSFQAVGVPVTVTEKLVLRTAAAPSTIYLTTRTLDAMKPLVPPAVFAEIGRVSTPSPAVTVAAATWGADETISVVGLEFSPQLQALLGDGKFAGAGVDADGKARSVHFAVPSAASASGSAGGDAFSPTSPLPSTAAAGTGLATDATAVAAGTRSPAPTSSSVNYAAVAPGSLPAPSAMRALSHTDFKLLRGLGSGHFATVYLALHRASRNLFAVKVIGDRHAAEPVQEPASGAEGAGGAAAPVPGGVYLRGAGPRQRGVAGAGVPAGLHAGRAAGPLHQAQRASRQVAAAGVGIGGGAPARAQHRAPRHQARQHHGDTDRAREAAGPGVGGGAGSYRVTEPAPSTHRTVPSEAGSSQHVCIHSLHARGQWLVAAHIRL